MTARLVAREGYPDILVGRAPMIVGRDPRCDILLTSIRVSRRHCCLTQVDGDVMVQDLGSANGVRINGRRVTSGRLRPGDELTIAHIGYRLEDRPESPTLLPSHCSIS